MLVVMIIIIQMNRSMNEELNQLGLSCDSQMCPGLVCQEWQLIE